MLDAILLDGFQFHTNTFDRTILPLEVLINF